jgi:hypothetical protein
MIQKKFYKLSLLLCLASIPFASYADDYIPKDFKIEIETKGFEGAKANLTARLDAPMDAVWRAVLDSNNLADKYPRINRSFCMSKEDAQESKKDGLRNGATVERRYKKRMCEPAQMRQIGEVWTYCIFQEFDYPFPLADRWIIATATNNEKDLKKGMVAQTGKLIYGRQDIFEFRLALSKYPQYPNQTKLDIYVWSDPGGIIADWMVKKATETIAPKFVEILEREGRLRANTQVND